MSESGEGENDDDGEVIVLTSEIPPASDERRAQLRTESSPDRHIDLLILLQATCCEGRVQIMLQYVPDRRILLRDALEPYLAALSGPVSDNLEILALTILDDINNELVPRWAQVVASEADSQDSDHRVLVEDRQPKWDNRALLARVRQW
jgi:hypothetical protein